MPRTPPRPPETPTAARPLRHYCFWVPGWTIDGIHDEVIDSTAEHILGMTIVIHRDSDPVKVYIAENPEPLWNVRRWRLFAALLANPDLSGRKEWAGVAGQLRSPLPAGLVMRVIEPDQFAYLVALHAAG